MRKTVSLKKNAIFNIVKQILKIAFPLITFPYVSRVLLDENLGKYNFTLSIIGYFALIAGLGINGYGLREGSRIRNDKDKCNKFANEIFTINLITTAVSYLLLLFLFVCWNKLKGYTLLLFVQSLTIIFTTLGVDWVNGIYEDYVYMTKRYIFVKIISLILIFLLIKRQEDYVLYAAIVVGSEILANCMNMFYVRRYLHVHPTRHINFSKHIFPLLVLFGNAVAITIYSNADITMLGIIKNDSAVGIYSVSSKMYQIAKGLINAIIVVVIPRLSAILGTGDMESYNHLLERSIKSIFVFMFPLITGMFCLSKECILILGGEAFLSGSSTVRIFSFALIPAAISSVFFDGILIANRKEKYCLIATVVSAVVNILLNLYFIQKFSFFGAAITTFIAEMVGCSLAIYFSRNCHKMHIAFDKDIISIFVGCAFIAVICILSGYIENLIIRLIVSVFSSAIIYSGVMILMKNSSVISLLHSMRRK